MAIETQKFETSKAVILAVRLPDGATGTALTMHNLHVDIQHGIKHESLNLPPGEWKELGIWGSVTEDKAISVVDDESVGLYVDYCGVSDFGKKRRFDTAIESLQSLLETGIKLRNPFGAMPRKEQEKYHNVWNATCFDRGYYESDLKKWQAAESQVWKNIYLTYKMN